ncbi:hypothetical protein WH47_10468 [Habropoda laboriosa]|uniref:Uncharacterized protein n=2 Tax=Habropoda laboriosa TaxID=597456 RepID=A0A0L7QMS6_9HYME|nr:hypothetical protein WH47_10468 [Habropoda laboriosa]
MLTQSQRPPYAGSSKPYPAVLPQYLDEQQAAFAASASVAGTTGSVVNRLDASNSNLPISGPAMTTTSTSTIPPDLPIDALGDINLVNRIKTWPRDKQPFWFINWQQIQEHRGDTRNKDIPTETQSYVTG